MNEDELQRKIREAHEITETRALRGKESPMKATVVITVHAVDTLGLEQLADLAQLVAVTFGRAAHMGHGTLEIQIVTSKPGLTFRRAEDLVAQVANLYGPDLWVSVSTDWRQS